MPEDDWDLEMEETDEAGEEAGAGPAAADRPASEGDKITDEEREAVRALRQSGMSPSEVLSRARRDYDREAYGSRSQDPPDNRRGEAEESDDPDAVLTKGEAKELISRATSKARHEARLESLQMQQYRLMQEVVSQETTQGLGDDLPAFKWKAISDEVAQRLAKNVKLMSLSDREFAEEVRKVAKDVVDEERKIAARIAGAGSVEELDNRLEAQRTAGQSGARGGTGKRSAPQGRVAELRKRVEQPEFGVSENRTWPSDQDLQDALDAEKEEHQANVRAGRA